MSFVTFEDFDTRYENTIPAADMQRVEAFLDDACSLVTDMVGIIYEGDATADPVVAAEDVPNSVIAVVCGAVRRAYANPLGLEGETIGDYSWRLGYRGPGIMTGVYFTAAEARIIRRAAGKLGVGSITLTNYLPVPLADPYFSITGEDEL